MESTDLGKYRVLKIWSIAGMSGIGTLVVSLYEASSAAYSFSSADQSIVEKWVAVIQRSALSAL